MRRFKVITFSLSTAAAYVEAALPRLRSLKTQYSCQMLKHEHRSLGSAGSTTRPQLRTGCCKLSTAAAYVEAALPRIRSLKTQYSCQMLKHEHRSLGRAGSTTRPQLRAGCRKLTTAAAYVEAALPERCGFKLLIIPTKNKGRIPKDPPFANKKG